MTTPLRPARTADVDRVAALEADIFGLDAWTPSQIGEELSAPGRAMLVATGAHDAEVIGYAVLGVTDEVADLLRIAVAHRVRRSGVAAALLAHLIRAAAAAGAERMLLEVSVANTAAIGFYGHVGFAQIHRRVSYYRDGTDALVLQRGLRVPSP